MLQTVSKCPTRATLYPLTFNYSNLNPTVKSTLKLKTNQLTQQGTLMQLSDLKPNQILSAYGPHLRVPLACLDASRTKQSFSDETNINNILAQYLKTGLIDYVNENQGRYGDVTGLDFQQAMDTVALGREMFDALPANIRDRFANDPARFLDFVDDPANDEEAIKLGIRTTSATLPSTQQAKELSIDPETAETPVKGSKKVDKRSDGESPGD